MNTLTGPRETFLIASQSPDKTTTISSCSSVLPSEDNSFKMRIHLNLEKNHLNSYKDIIATKVFSINTINNQISELQQCEAAKIQNDITVSDYELDYSKDKTVVFVKNSPLKIGLELLVDLPLENEQQRMLIAQIKSVEIAKNYITTGGKIHHSRDNGKQEGIAISIQNTHESDTINRTSSKPHSEERSDNVVFDEVTQTYNASLLPFATNVGAPKIEATNLASWKSANANNFNHLFKEKLESVKKEYEALVTAFNTNEMLYNTAMNFKPIVGKTYHLYRKDSGENFLSLLPPESFKKKHLGAYKLNGDKVWEAVMSKVEVYG
ncbi:MAG: DUF2452 domain-containing protein [Flavicella sp.]